MLLSTPYLFLLNTCKSPFCLVLHLYHMTRVVKYTEISDTTTFRCKVGFCNKKGQARQQSESDNSQRLATQTAHRS